MARRNKATTRTVLPQVTSKAGTKNIRSVDQILTTKQRTALRSDLSEMARRRREAEASSSTLRLS